MHAFLLMLIYGVLGKLRIYEAIERSILEEAFKLYGGIQAELQIPPARNISMINDAWSVACELRDKKTYIRHCSSCQVAYVKQKAFLCFMPCYS